MAMEHSVLLNEFAVQAGGLIEIYAAGTDRDGWLRAFRALREAGYPVVVTDNESGAVAVGSQMFEEFNGRYSVAVSVGRQIWTATMHAPDVIDLQGDPRDVTSSGDLDDVLQLMRRLHEALGRPVILVPETLNYESIEPYVTVP